MSSETFVDQVFRQLSSSRSKDLSTRSSSSLFNTIVNVMMWIWLVWLLLMTVSLVLEHKSPRDWVRITERVVMETVEDLFPDLFK
jgi:hypothetical protein